MKGFRVLAVAVGPPAALRLAGIISLSDPPRDDSGALVAELRSLGVRTIMITGDAPATAAIVAHEVGIDGPVCPPGPVRTVQPGDFAVFAGVMPEGKFNLVKALQKGGHTVGMCGDGANDAPALRQAQMGIAVSTATDVAKSAAGIVLTKPGLERNRRLGEGGPRDVSAHPDLYAELSHGKGLEDALSGPWAYS
jgi:H+-transporting ATPase